MADNSKEPQSYGSEKEWLTGKTDQKLDQQPEPQSPRENAFYDSRREKETSGATQGGIEAGAEASDPAHHRDTGDVPVLGSAPKKITQYSDKRRSYFRKRDYSS